VAVKLAGGEYYCDVGQAAQAFCQGGGKQP
jgi:hypothetical protein